MEIVLLAVGKLRPSLREVCDDYLARLRRWAKIAEHEVREAGRAPTPDAGRSAEARALLARLPAQATLVALARRGAAWTSEELARQLERWRIEARPLALLVGGSHGLGEEVLARARAEWSLGPLTLPHELARVVVCEQLYRAFSLLEGHPYHKGAPGPAAGPRRR
ncbi:MAG TPA: 23S rRNA (pseudouridine(1915)-N(3))-methyltransferase RlmH [Gemmatimonadales bacterium]|nr:23S rRNA (pseudouridine(1915)-N(3))-methyltransferase RlmH [Gemmatimonadales bacterium]